MNTNKIITPDHVRWVLGIKPFGMAMSDDKIVYHEKGIKNEIDIPRFIYLAIEKCAAEGYIIEVRWNGFMRQRTIVIGRIDGTGNFYEYEDWDYDRDTTLLHAQLAAIAWVYGKIQQEGK